MLFYLHFPVAPWVNISGGKGDLMALKLCGMDKHIS